VSLNDEAKVIIFDFAQVALFAFILDLFFSLLAWITKLYQVHSLFSLIF
jgi:hypothetical protein